MLSYRNAVKLLPPGDIVYSLSESRGVEQATVMEVCDGWLETSIGILDFDDHGTTWWLTRTEAIRQSEGAIS